VFYWIIHLVLSAIALIIVAKIVPVIGLVSATVGAVLKIVLLLFIVLTLGLVYFLVNGLMLKLASEFVPGFRVIGCLPAVLGLILLYGRA
jgi:putative membrane protein